MPAEVGYDSSRDGSRPSASAASLTATTESRPRASAARNRISIPTPVKKPMVSRNCRLADDSDPSDPATGNPGRIEPFFTTRTVTEPPTMNHAPPTAASSDPKMPIARLAVLVTSSPPIRAAAPGTIDRYSRPDVYAHALSGVYAKWKYGPTNGARPPHAPSRISSTPLTLPRLRGIRVTPVILLTPSVTGGLRLAQVETPAGGPLCKGLVNA